jgi:superkiller protein 3
VEEAIAAFQAPTRVERQNKVEIASAHLRLADELRALGKVDEAIAAYKEAIRFNPSPAAYHNLEVTIASQGRAEQAIAVYQEIIHANPEDALGYRFLANALQQKDQLDEAIAAYRKCLELTPDDVIAYNGFRTASYVLGKALKTQGKVEEAITAYKALVRVKPDDAHAHLTLGNELMLMGKVDEAIVALREAVRLRPGTATYHQPFVRALRQGGRLDEALVACREFIRLEPDGAAASGELGETLRQLGESLQLKDDSPRAIAVYEELIREQPNDIRGYVHLAEILTTCADLKLRDPKRALELGEKAVELTPKNAYCWGTLGMARYRAADWQGAIAALNMPEKRTGWSASERFFLAMAHAKLGKPVEARRWYDQALSLIERISSNDTPQAHRLRGDAEEVLELKKM